MLLIVRCHGWLVDPDDKETYSVLSGASYNRAVEWIVAGKEAAHILLEYNDSEEASSSSKQVLPKKSDLEKQVETGLIVDQFLTNHSSQLTYHGMDSIDCRFIFIGNKFTSQFTCCIISK